MKGNPEIARLYNMSQNADRIIIGLMSGTSLDGLDVALCHVKGFGKKTEVSVLEFETVPYDEAFRTDIRRVFSKGEISLMDLTLLHARIGTLHGAMVLACLKQWRVATHRIDLIASHGQTVFHAPKSLHGLANQPNATLQIGDADHIAMKTGITTVSDFRQKHIAAGGEGAPLAVYGDYLMFSKPGENRILLNIGGIANFTYLPGSTDAGEVFSTDTGPGNTLLDGFTQAYYPGMQYDKGGEIAKSGTVNPVLLAELKAHPFFDRNPPKTTGPELFNRSFVEDAVARIGIEMPSPRDMLATLVWFTAETMVDCIRKAVKIGQEYRVYASGGGSRNDYLMAVLSQLLDTIPLDYVESLGVSGDAKEAVLFAVLANEMVAGGDRMFGNEAMGTPKVKMGKISFPV